MTVAKELVLGGEGLIGTEVVSILAERGSDARSLDLKSGIDIVTCDSGPFEWADRIWFLAWDLGGVKYLNDPTIQHEQFMKNCALMHRVFDMVHSLAKPCLFASSQLAGQRNAYGTTKLLGEVWAQTLGAKVARLWNVYGWEEPGVRSHVVTDFTVAALTGGPIQCRTTGEERRRLLYKSDCAQALVQLFDGDEVYADVAGERWITVRELALRIATARGVEARFGDELGEEVPIDPLAPVPGWKPSVPFEQGLQLVLRDAEQYLTQAR